MKLVFLGTGTSLGVPIIGCPCDTCRSEDPRDKRLRSSVLIRHKKLNVVIDAGPDFRAQMLKAGVDSLDAIVLTHEHKDHVAGLDDIRAYNFNYRRPMDIYAELRVQKAIQRDFAYVFSAIKYPGVPQMNLHSIDNSSFKVKGLEFIPIRAFHYKLPILGFRVKDIAYITDAKYIEDSELKKLKGVKVLIINALRWKVHMSHFNVEEALEFISKVKPEKAYLTHLGHQIGRHKEAQEKLPENVYFAYDGLEIKSE